MVRFLNVSAFKNPSAFITRYRRSVGNKVSPFQTLLTFDLPNSPVHRHQFLVQRNQADDQYYFKHVRFNGSTSVGPGIAITVFETMALLQALTMKSVESFSTETTISEGDGRKVTILLKTNAWQFLKISSIKDGAKVWVEIPTFRLRAYISALNFVISFMKTVNAKLTPEAMQKEVLPPLLAELIEAKLCEDPCRGCVENVFETAEHNCLAMTEINGLVFKDIFINKAKQVLSEAQLVKASYEKICLLLGNSTPIPLSHDLHELVFGSLSIYLSVFGQEGGLAYTLIPEPVVQMLLNISS